VEQEAGRVPPGGNDGDSEEVDLIMETMSGGMRAGGAKRAVARSGALELLEGLVQVSELLGASEFRSDAAANLVWGLAKLYATLHPTSEGVFEGVERGEDTGVADGSEMIDRMVTHGERGDTEVCLLQDLLVAFLAGYKQCQASGASCRIRRQCPN
jgi:hypothetical protein